MTDPKRTGRREIFDGRVFGVTVDRFAAGDGAREFEIEVVHHNGGAAVLPVESDGRVVLIRQWRYPIGRLSIEVPAGRLEAGESPEATALRELEEEAGLRASHVEPLAEIMTGPGYTTERIYLFLATGLEHVGQRLDEDERIRPLLLRLDEALAMVDLGEIDDAKTVVALLRYATRAPEGGSR